MKAVKYNLPPSATQGWSIENIFAASSGSWWVITENIQDSVELGQAKVFKRMTGRLRPAALYKGLYMFKELEAQPRIVDIRFQPADGLFVEVDAAILADIDSEVDDGAAEPDPAAEIEQTLPLK